MVAISIIIALAVNGLIINPGYQWILRKANLEVKPLNCVYCLTFWIGVILNIFSFNIYTVAIPLTASFIAVCLERWFNNLPSKIK